MQAQDFISPAPNQPASAPAGPVISPVSPVPVSATQRPAAKAKHSLAKTIAIIILSVVAAALAGLFAWTYVAWDDAHTDVEGKIKSAVALAVNENTTKLEQEFTEREKNPYTTFAGPVDYGELSFEHPKTWSVYVAKDASDGRSDFEAYLNPGVVSPVAVKTINAARVYIQDQSFENITKAYDNNIKKGTLTQSVRQVNDSKDAATVFTGELPTSKLQGIAVVFKIRDKVATVQTDAMIFKADFFNLVDTIKFNQ